MICNPFEPFFFVFCLVKKKNFLTFFFFLNVKLILSSRSFAPRLVVDYLIEIVNFLINLYGLITRMVVEIRR